MPRWERWTIFGAVVVVAIALATFGFLTRGPGPKSVPTDTTWLLWILAILVFVAGLLVLVWRVPGHVVAWWQSRSAGPLPTTNWAGTVRPRLPDAAQPPLISQAVATVAPPATTEPQPERKRVFVNETPEYLTGLFKDRTAIQAQKLADPYYGKWMKVSGPVGSVGSWTGYFVQVTFDRGDLLRGYMFGEPPPAVFMMFRDESVLDRLAILEPGDQITVVGSIERIDRTSVQLRDCELV